MVGLLATLISFQFLESIRMKVVPSEGGVRFPRSVALPVFGLSYQKRPTYCLVFAL